MSRYTLVQQHQDNVTAGRISNDWMTDAACVERPDLPWLTDGPGNDHRRAMGLVCGVCPVREACADYVTAAHISGGFWAGRNRDRDRFNRNPAGNVASLPAARQAWTNQTRDARHGLDHAQRDGWVS